ncbi:MAG: succinate--CoA ligase subunit alpha [Pseudomonadota bacterium]
MSVLVDQDTKIIVQGITGRAGTFYTDSGLRYGSNFVAGVRPGKGGGNHLDVPLFDRVRDAVAETGANASMILVPAQNAASAMIEAIEAEVKVIVCVTERVPVHDMIRVKDALRQSDSLLIGPNSQGILSPGKCKIGVMSTTHAQAGSVGIITRSASLASELVAQTSHLGLGQSTTIGVGGDPIHGIGFRQCLELFKDDPQTRGVVLVGEIGGTEEEEAADYLSSGDYGKPVVTLIVGRHAPKERRMGHAGTLSLFGSKSVSEKESRLAQAGVQVVENADMVAPAMRQAIRSRS